MRRASPRLDRPQRRGLALACLGLAAFAHERCCEWRTIEYETARASAFEERALWTVRREEHTSGNAAAWDEKQRELRAYHADWLACWETLQGGRLESRPTRSPQGREAAAQRGEAERSVGPREGGQASEGGPLQEKIASPSAPGVADCTSRLDPLADATTRAVDLASCEGRHAVRVSRSRGFRRCLAGRGHQESPAPRWTRDVFGIRFDEPYVTLTALFAEDLGGPARSRALCGGFGVGLPIGLCGAALLLARKRAR